MAANESASWCSKSAYHHPGGAAEGGNMSVFIKGMEMPKDGAFVGVLIWSDGRVTKRGDSYLAEDGKHYYRPCAGECFSAIPVPPHGRLVDADALIDDLPNNLGIRGLEYLNSNESAIVSWIHAAPTIIEADGEGEE